MVPWPQECGSLNGIFRPFQGLCRSGRRDRLAALRRSGLVRDDESDPGGRIYKDPGTGEVFHSVTRILGATAPEQQQKALANWLERPWAPMERDTAARRGTAAHSGAEYLLKTANRLARNTANRRNAWRTTDQGLERAPTAITRWALDKTHGQVPAMPWGFACLLYTSPSPRDGLLSRMPSSA